LKNETDKMVAKTVLQIIGGTPKVICFYDDDKKYSVDIFIGKDRPFECITSYSTIGLSNHSINLVTSTSKELRIELIGACNNEYDLFPNILSTCSFNIIKDKSTCQQGIVFTNTIEHYYKDIAMKHIVFVDPFMWGNIPSLELEDRVITWLMAVPISQSEFEFLKQYGISSLENLFEEKEVDVCDLKRNSAV